MRSVLKKQELLQCSYYLFSLERNVHSKQFYFLSPRMRCGYVHWHVHAMDFFTHKKSSVTGLKASSGTWTCASYLPWAVCDGLLPLLISGCVWRGDLMRWSGLSCLHCVVCCKHWVRVSLGSSDAGSSLCQTVDYTQAWLWSRWLPLDPGRLTSCYWVVENTI